LAVRYHDLPSLLANRRRSQQGRTSSEQRVAVWFAIPPRQRSAWFLQPLVLQSDGVAFVVEPRSFRVC
jgi:hypothetical protein